MSDRALKRAQQPSFQQDGHTVDMRKQILAELWCVARDRVMEAAESRSFGVCRLRSSSTQTRVPARERAGQKPRLGFFCTGALQCPSGSGGRR
ncbi:MAG: hypothetical protein RL077_4747 [Verrucomicrobiota bacterium]|jgi:hypothetical protein